MGQSRYESTEAASGQEVGEDAVYVVRRKAVRYKVQSELWRWCPDASRQTEGEGRASRPAKRYCRVRTARPFFPSSIMTRQLRPEQTDTRAVPPEAQHSPGPSRTVQCNSTPIQLQIDHHGRLPLSQVPLVQRLILRRPLPRPPRPTSLRALRPALHHHHAARLLLPHARHRPALRTP